VVRGSDDADVDTNGLRREDSAAGEAVRWSDLDVDGSAAKGRDKLLRLESATTGDNGGEITGETGGSEVDESSVGELSVEADMSDRSPEDIDMVCESRWGFGTVGILNFLDF